MGIGKSTAGRHDQETDTTVTFDDVAGIDEAENELVEILGLLRDPQITRDWAARLRKACCWSARQERETL
jgi:ATP-dependent Zn protease